jgi:hypothetical protein
MFGEFMRFFPKCLNPFKIQTRFKFELFSESLIQNLEGIGSQSKKGKLFHDVYLVT